jgi:hypothetical protein
MNKKIRRIVDLKRQGFIHNEGISFSEQDFRRFQFFPEEDQIRSTGREMKQENFSRPSRHSPHVRGEIFSTYRNFLDTRKFEYKITPVAVV